MVSASSPSPVFPGLLTENIGLYRTRPETFLASFLVHVMGLALVLWLAIWILIAGQTLARKSAMPLTSVRFHSYQASLAGTAEAALMTRWQLPEELCPN